MAFMIKWVPMLEAEVSVAVFTDHFHEFFLPATRLPAFISEDLNTDTAGLALLLSRVRPAVTINVLPNDKVWRLSSFNRDWDVTEGTNWNLHILLVRGAAVVEGVHYVVFAENLLTGVTFER